MLHFRAKATHTSGELLSIQYLRGIAALTVLVSHTLQWPLAHMSEGLLRSGRLGVEIFFVISGFIITLVGGDASFDRCRFLWRRVQRVVPLYWGATIVVAVAAMALPALFRTTVPTPLGLLESLLFIPSDAPKAPLLGVGWTLDYEAFFYLLFALLSAFSSKIRTGLICAILLSLLLVGQFSAHPSDLQYFYTSPSLLGFGMGTLLAQAQRHGLLAWLTRLPVTILLVVPCLLVTAFFMVPAAEQAGRAPIYFHIVMSATAISIVGGLLMLELAGRLRPMPSLYYLGDASYSIYLFHLFVVSAGWAIAHRLWPAQPEAVYFAIAAVTSVLALMAGLAAHHLFERPLLRLFRRMRHKRQPEPGLMMASTAA